MKNSKVFTALAALALIAALAACGGGGGGAGPTFSGGGEVTTPVGGNTPTMTITYTATSMCASGPNLTSTVSQLAANALVPSACPALPASVLAQANVVVGSGTLNISVTGLPAGFTGGTLAATKVTPSTTAFWDLIPTTTGNASATLRAGSAAVSFNTVYNGSIMMNFAGAPSANKTITFTTGADPAVTALTQAKDAIIPQGVQKVIPATEVPTSVTLVTDKGFLDCVVSGCVLLIDTGDKMSNTSVIANRTRDLVYAAYRQNGNYYVKALFKDDLTGATPPELTRALTGAVVDRFQGASNGMLARYPNQSVTCGLARWDIASGSGFGGENSAACPVWN